ncbi:hypothetical protein [Chitinophaga sp. YIM B06452]|uniref:hypothetical protein n=1 Tax=Chitinophaga sp. YIM B06452 TaxID=3082158 RepID=UPI0031FE8E54
MRDFLADYSNWFYWGWVVVFSIHFYLNIIIYIRIEKEEFEDFRRGYDVPQIVLAVFTLRWSPEYQSDEGPVTKKMMRSSNVISKVLIVYTIMNCLIWGIVYNG